MVAGLNLKIDIIRMNQAGDDDVGGAVYSGTVYYNDLAARISARRPSQAALESGLEVDRIFDMVIIGKGLTINERDEVEVKWPLEHPYYGERFRITGFQLDGRRQPYGHRQFTLSRIERSRSRQ